MTSQTKTSSDLLALLETARRELELDLRVSVPGTIAAFDPLTATATITVGFLTVREVAGVEIPQPPLVLTGVPVAYLKSNTGSVTVPLLPGDTGLVMFADRALENWRTKAGVPLDPKASRAHDMSDGVFFPGLSHDANALSAVDLSATVIDGALLVKLGKLAASPAVKGTEYLLAFTTYTAAVTAAFATWAAIPPTIPGNAALSVAMAAANVALMLALAGSVSLKVLVE